MKKPDTKSTLIAFRTEPDMLAALEKIAERLDRSVSWLVRKATEEFIERNKK